ncbi:hypothetical protein KKA15_00265 [Patescibacteria group bacterium]|nr:hypothetical protein [Patescibacteria group bacterium]
MPNPSQDFYWERLFILSLIGAGTGASISYLSGIDWRILVVLGVAVAASFSTVMQADKVYGIKPEKKGPPLSIEKITKEQFEEQMPDDFKDFEK